MSDQQITHEQLWPILTRLTAQAVIMVKAFKELAPAVQAAALEVAELERILSETAEETE